MSLVLDTFRRAVAPNIQLNAADWLRECFYLHDGRAFSEHSVPWITAPHGPCWAYDSLQFREIWLQWAARMFKTNFGLAMLIRRMDQRPGESMFATPDETNCKAVFGRVWNMIDNNPNLRAQAPREARRALTVIRLKHAVCHGAWPRGKSRLADKSIPVGHANEIDKWEHQTTSTEGDPLPRFLKRGAEYADRKFVLESTPGTRGISRVEAGRLRSTNHRYEVPCPHCQKFQSIEFDGIQWDKLPSGKSEPTLARRTAHYVCRYCDGRIEDLHRPGMMNAGVWVPFGCTVDHDRAHRARDLPPDDRSWYRGEPAMWGSEYGSQLPVWYALFHGWGDIAYDFLRKKSNPADLRQWTNEDKGETWDTVLRRETWEALGTRMIGNLPRYIVPAEYELVTIGIDKQQADYVYEVTAWKGDLGHTLDYGRIVETDQLQDLVEAKWSREDGTQLKAAAVMIDSGYRPADVHAFVRQCTSLGVPIRACRGSHGQAIAGYYVNRINSKRSSNPGQWVTYVDTHSTQDWVDQHMKDESSLFEASLAEHQDYLQQLLNEGLVAEIDSRGNAKEHWNRLDTGMPNDYRDCKRYAFVGKLLAGKGATPSNRTTQTQQPKPTAGRGLVSRPGGWLRGMQ